MINSNLFSVQWYPIFIIILPLVTEHQGLLKNITLYQVWADGTNVSQAIYMCFFGLKSF